jgi:hypothetical protein
VLALSAWRPWAWPWCLPTFPGHQRKLLGISVRLARPSAFGYALVVTICAPLSNLRARAPVHGRWAIVRGGFRAWPRCVLGSMLPFLLRSRVRVFYCVARALQGCASASAHSALITHVALQVLFHAALCEVASPDGVVGREWCYVEVRLLARPIWSTTSSRSFVRMFVCMYVKQCSRACARARGVGLHVRTCWRGCANVNMQGRRWWPGFRGLGPWVVSKKRSFFADLFANAHTGLLRTAG